MTTDQFCVWIMIIVISAYIGKILRLLKPYARCFSFHRYIVVGTFPFSAAIVVQCDICKNFYAKCTNGQYRGQVVRVTLKDVEEFRAIEEDIKMMEENF